MNLKPLFDKVVCVKTKNTTQHGIILPKEMEEKPDIAKVIAVGSGGFVDGEHVTMQVTVGDTVLYNKYAASEFVLDGETYILLKQTDILAIIE